MTKDWANNKMNPWVPSITPHQARRVGKTTEEVGELAAVLGRLQIQAMGDIDPSSGKTNFQRFWEESADVEAQTTCNKEAFKFPEPEYGDRVALKLSQMGAWEQHYEVETATAPEKLGGHLHVGNSNFEDWYSRYCVNIPANPKQAARDAYAAGMSDPLVEIKVPADDGPIFQVVTELFTSSKPGAPMGHSRFVRIKNGPVLNGVIDLGSRDGVNVTMTFAANMFEHILVEK